MLQIATILKTADGYIFHLEYDPIEQQLLWTDGDLTFMYQDLMQQLIIEDIDSPIPDLTIAQTCPLEKVQKSLWLRFTEVANWIQEQEKINSTLIKQQFPLPPDKIYPQWLETFFDIIEERTITPNEATTAYFIMLIIINQVATLEQIDQMAEAYEGLMIKLAVDVKLEILAGGGELHADCEQILLEKGSEQENIWGADWYPELKRVGFESLINIRPRQNNRSMEIQDPILRKSIEKIVRHLLEIN